MLNVLPDELFPVLAPPISNTFPRANGSNPIAAPASPAKDVSLSVTVLGDGSAVLSTVRLISPVLR